MEINTVIQGDCLEVLKTLPDKSIDCCVTSPPYYGLRDYGTGKWIGGNPDCPHKRMSKFSENTITGHGQEELRGNVGDAIYKSVCPLCGAIREDKQIGLEETPEQYIEKLVQVFREVKRVLKDDGTLWVNIGDSYWGSGSRGYDFTGKMSEASKLQSGNKGTENLSNIPKLVGKTDSGIKNKDLVGIPWMLAFALRSDGWYLRQDIIWAKKNCMPQSVKDRCTTSHEYIFLLSKKPHYYFDYKAIQEDAVSKDDKRYGQGRIDYDGKRAQGDDDKAQNSFVMITDKRNKRDVWNDDSKYTNIEQEASVRQGIHKGRGENVIKKRYNLPNHQDFVKFLKERTSVDYLDNHTNIKRTTIEHWFREDESGFSYPSIENWSEIRQFVDDNSEEFNKIDSMISDVTYETDDVNKNNDGKRNKRDVWRVSTKAVKEAHFATFPEELIKPCILAGCKRGGVVLDPFFGSGTTGRVSISLGRNYLGIELNENYIDISDKRTNNVQMTMEGMG